MGSIEEKEPDGSVQDPPPSPYCILSEREKIFTILITSLVNFLGPASSDVYYPALDLMAKDLNVSSSKMNLTITTFMIIQGLAPLLTANLSDQKGRRPVLIFCLSFYFVVNIGLALQNSFPVLLALRCLQSFGSSGAIIVSIATVADLVTRAERGKYMAYSSLGLTVGPAVGPLLGGILTQSLGWRSIFWFLAILAGVIILVIVFFFREPCRAVVGNGSLPPQKWNRPVVLELVRPRSYENPDYETLLVPPQPTEDRKHGFIYGTIIGVLDSLKIVFNKPVSLLILCSTAIYCGFTAVLSSIPHLLGQKYHFNALQIGLCYIPFAAGGFAARWTMGALADWNFRRHGRKVGIQIQPNQQSRELLLKIPLEKVRLQLTLPLLYLSCLYVLGYGWIMNYNIHLSGALIMLFLLGNATVGMNTMLSTLIIDMYAYRPATALAGMNMYKFCGGAGAAAAVLPLMHIMGIGWVGTLIAGTWLLVSPGLWIIYFYGHAWRKQSQGEEA